MSADYPRHVRRLLVLLGFSPAAEAGSTCPAGTIILEELTCSSSVDGKVNGIDPSYLGGTVLDAYTCGSPYAPLNQEAGEDVYSFECQVDGDVTLEVNGMDCDLDI